MKYSIITLKKKNITDFAKERNKLLQKAKTEWVLFMDSDEKMSNALKKEILSKISTSEVEQDQKVAFFVFRKNYFLGKYVGCDKIIRLAKRNAGNWIRAVHETWQIKGLIGNLKNDLIHNTADNLTAYLNKINFYSTIHAKENKKEGKSVNLIKIIFYPIAKFFVELVKSRNAVFSIMQSFHSFLSWSKQWELENL